MDAPKEKMAQKEQVDDLYMNASEKLKDDADESTKSHSDGEIEPVQK